MNYEFWLWILVAFIVGRLSKVKVYIGSDEKKYSQSDIGILLK